MPKKKFKTYGGFPSICEFTNVNLKFWIAVLTTRRKLKKHFIIQKSFLRPESTYPASFDTLGANLAQKNSQGIVPTYTFHGVYRIGYTPWRSLSSDYPILSIPNISHGQYLLIPAYISFLSTDGLTGDKLVSFRFIPI